MRGWAGGPLRSYLSPFGLPIFAFATLPLMRIIDSLQLAVEDRKVSVGDLVRGTAGCIFARGRKESRARRRVTAGPWNAVDD